MIEPEMAFYDLEMDMQVIEAFIKSVVGRILDKCSDELNVLERDVERLKNVMQPFPRVTHNDAAKILRGELEVNGRNALKCRRKTFRSDHSTGSGPAGNRKREEKIKTHQRRKKIQRGKIIQLRKEIEILTEKPGIPTGSNPPATSVMT